MRNTDLEEENGGVAEHDLHGEPGERDLHVPALHERLRGERPPRRHRVLVVDQTVGLFRSRLGGLEPGHALIEEQNND